MADDKENQTFLQKLLFYTTAFFILLGTFSLFAFLFLVPFVIDPAFTTIFMQFETQPAECVTIDVESRRGTRNCSWTSCREGCTKELYDCTQIRVNYKLPVNGTSELEDSRLVEEGRAGGGVEGDEEANVARSRRSRALREYDYAEEVNEDFGEENDFELAKPYPTGLMGNDSEWYFTGAKLFPNVKGCGYPPMLNCSVFYKQYTIIGHNFSCYYSKVDPGIVISDLDMWQVRMNLVYAMAIPIPSFIVSVIYLTIAYFKIYNEEEEVLVDREEVDEGIDVDGSNATPLPPTSGALTPGSEAFREDLASFGHQLKVAMADDISRESLDGIPNSLSVQGDFVYFQKLEQDDDDEYLNSTWADGGSLKRHFQGLNNISWKPH
ncbi:protein tipE isoform X1 [Neodiprion pinetum]|uniref:protein tipE isoform X1 n=1 Tax=Neodiprion pinetum TaxID=441929 RepID=UPI001EDEB1CB|nr:protein tipE isoform X1 [Neodiprion pinetum]XP_046491003.1 protein tipE isoform X1 [Neodiprion pinetum]XP_046491004.1 protein tipE isoform X1 [Neodiprion pinetum]XP_046491005.1 protein tipE isoform X1 [Neodiprion pinetum]XP_046491006.1 protein tipE isoform X1 [Neodiprion pinetum]